MTADPQEQAIEFRHCYGVTNSPDKEEMQLRLIQEEFKEFFDEDEPENKLKELADLVYVAFQYAENREWDLMTALHRVHKSNMSKLGPDRRPIRREDGKILKGPNYQPPVLTDLV